MIQANELRIGNCHYINGDQIGRITEQGILYVDQGTMEFEPIPLTPEILEKSGFKNICPDFYRKKVREYSVDGIVHFESVAVKPPQYLHQLQNIYFALTGEELTIDS